MNKDYISISEFCKRLWTSRQYFYLHEERIREISDIQYKVSLGNLTKTNLMLIRQFFEDNTRVKVKQKNEVKIEAHQKYTVKEWISKIWLTYPSLLNWLQTKEFQELKLPFLKKVNLINISSVKEVKSKLINK